MSKYIIAHDLGTSGNKATLFSTEGKLIKSAVLPYDAHFFNVCCAEQDPADWWHAVCTTTRELLQGIDPEDVLAISFSAHMMGCLPVDAQGNPLRPSIIWADTRSTREAEAVAEKIDPKTFFHIVGHRLSSSYTLTKIMWLKNNEPEIYEKAHCFLQAKDYIVFKLTGQMMTDYSDASGTNMFDINTFEWSKTILDAAGVDMGKLPKPMPSTTVAGTVLPDVAKECGLSTSTKVVLGGGDGMCASVGAGSISEGKTYSCLGTSAWIATAAKKPIFDEGMVLTNWAHVVPGYVTPLGTMQAAGASFSWLKNNICTSEAIEAKEQGKSVYDLINEAIASAPAGSNGIVYLPYLLGERSPRWNVDAKGCFLGLKMVNTRADMLRSVIEGIGYNLRVVLNAMTENGVDVDSISLVGGMAKGKVQREIFASVWNRPVQQLNFIEEAGSIGAAVIGGVGVGAFESFEAVNRFIQPVDTIQPDPESVAVYDEYQKVFDNAYNALYPVFPEMTKLSNL